MVFNLSVHDSIANRFLAELRNTDIQADRMRFRKNVERIGEILAYEISKTLRYSHQSIATPLTGTKVMNLAEEPVLISIMRAGIPFLQGFLNFFDHAETGFIGAYRSEDGNNFRINLEYAALPSVKDREVILIDPMLATGSSVVSTMDLLLRQSRPRKIHIAAVIAAPEGIAKVEEYFSSTNALPFAIWTGSVDQYLNDDLYIVPGLGDAGDLSFGQKISV